MKVDYNKVELQSGIKLNGIYTKGDKITFLDLKPEDELKVRTAMEEICHTQI